MFLVPVGMAFGADVTWRDFLYKNLVPVTLGNIVAGGAQRAVPCSTAWPGAPNKAVRCRQRLCGRLLCGALRQPAQAGATTPVARCSCGGPAMGAWTPGLDTGATDQEHHRCCAHASLH